MEEEEQVVFKAFDAFDFENNGDFQKGWSRVKTVVEPDSIKREYLKAKAFFFSKCIQSFDFPNYMVWKAKDQNGHLQFHSKTNDDIPNTSERAETINDGCIANTKDSGSKKPSLKFADESSKEGTGKKLIKVEEHSNHFKDTSSNTESITSISSIDKSKEAESSNESEMDKSLSLAELAAYVQNGIPIPGLISVDVQPTNKDPTPSSLSRKLKPWELKKSLENSDGQS